MFHPTSQIDRRALVSVAALLLGTTLVPDASGWQQPATPCPCAADGVCQPNGPWGHTATKWRPWPGDVVGTAPTAAEEAETRKQLRLDPFELPSPEKEDQRGPTKAKPPKARRDRDVDVEPAAPPLPEAKPLEGIDPGAFGIQDEFHLEPPTAEQPQQGAEPLPGLDLQEETEPASDFDPFSQLDQRIGTPVPVNRRTSLAPPASDDTLPQLPPSLRKLSRRSLLPTRQATLQNDRFPRLAVAMNQ